MAELINLAGLMFVLSFPHSPATAMEDLNKHYGLVKVGETIGEISGVDYIHVKNKLECAKYCSKTDCYTFGYGGNLCFKAHLWLAGGDTYTAVLKPGFQLFSLSNDCDETVQHCQQIRVANADYGTCDGIYQLQSTTKYQRPIYYSATARRYISYSHYWGKWLIYASLDTSLGGYQGSEVVPVCHPMDPEALPWSHSTTLTCL